jgi:serine/threonine protein kinase
MEVAPSEKTSPPFGRYVIRERMAEGGMGEVFLAVAVGADGFEKPVVVKRLLPKFAGRSDIINLLAAEAKLMTRLVHPNIVQVIDFGRGDKDDYFLVMELVGGTNLAGFCQAYAARGTRIPVPVALYIVNQVLRGLAYAHAIASADGKRLVHRDISPGNILLSNFGEVKVADFGVALVASSAESAKHDGWLVGKPAYMAPEQLEQTAVDERADIYAVGAVLFQVLTGSLHRGEAAPEIHAEADFELSAHANAVLADTAPKELVEIVVRALSPRREARYADARQMARAIEQLVEMGQKMATADELAEAVSEVIREQPKRTKSVVILGEAESGGLASGTELTRIGAQGDKRGFTLKIQASSKAPAPLLEKSTERIAPRGSGRWFMLGALGVALVLLAAGLAWRRSAQPRDRQEAVLKVPAAVSAALDVPHPRIAIAANDDPVGAGPWRPAAELALPSATPSAGAPAARRAVGSLPTRASNAREVQREAAGAKEPAAPGAQGPTLECRGQLHLYAGHGWVLSGGPGAVQAPGRYNWPCGTYALKAVSRLDSRDLRSMSVTIREGVPGVIDLR